MIDVDFERAYKLRLTGFEAALERALSARRDIPERLAQAMRYSLMAGGKRIRPILLIGFSKLWPDGDPERATAFACALEMIHTYSLIHDDLPAMDDDALRRGQPTCHIQFGEGLAILAGDALLNLAYQTMLDSCDSPGAARAARLIADAAGAGGMIAGQCLDLQAGDAHSDGDQTALLEAIHSGKTGALLTAPPLAGLTLCGAPDIALEHGRAFGRHLGLAFQIQDDILDVTGDAHQLGKPIGSDQRNGKLTFISAYGIKRARLMAEEYFGSALRALEALEALGADGEELAFLRGLTRFLLERRR